MSLHDELVAARRRGAVEPELSQIASEYLARRHLEELADDTMNLMHGLIERRLKARKRKPGATTRARWQDILDALPGSTDVVAQRADVQPGTARRDLRRMRERGMVEGDGSWWERAR